MVPRETIASRHNVVSAGGIGSPAPPTDATVNAPFKVDLEELGNGIRAINVAGELDHATAPELRSRLEEAIGAGSGNLLLDLTECGFVDSTGLSLIIDAHRRMTHQNGRRFVLCCATDEVRRLFELTSLDKAVALHTDRDEAIAALRG
jgi:anti-anti-sigma factor